MPFASSRPDPCSPCCPRMIPGVGECIRGPAPPTSPAPSATMSPRIAMGVGRRGLPPLPAPTLRPAPCPLSPDHGTARPVTLTPGWRRSYLRGASSHLPRIGHSRFHQRRSRIRWTRRLRSGDRRSGDEIPGSIIVGVGTCRGRGSKALDNLDDTTGAEAAALSPSPDTPRYKFTRTRSAVALQLARATVEGVQNRRAFRDVKHFVFFIGYPHSGSSLIGSLLNCHPEAVISHETDILRFVRPGITRQQLFALVLDGDRRFAAVGRRWMHIDYDFPGTHQGNVRTPPRCRRQDGTPLIPTD